MNRVPAPGTPPIDHLQIDYFHVLFQSRSIIACDNCISKLARAQPLKVSPNSLDHGLPVHLQTHSITASKFISEFTQSRSPIAFPNSLDHGLNVHLQTWLITASKCITEFTRYRPPSALLQGCLIPIINTTFIKLSTTAYLVFVSLLVSSWNSTSSLRLARASKSNLLQCPSPK